jgi:predicted DNA-binding transcriptional regulator AlpA
MECDPGDTNRRVFHRMGGGQLPASWAVAGIAIGLLGMGAATIYALERKTPSPRYPGPIILGIAALTWALIGWQTWMWFHPSTMAVAATWTATPKNNATPDEPIIWQQPFQLMPIGTTSGTQIGGMYFQGISNSQIQMKEAYIVSEMTGHKEQLKANVQYKGEFAVDQVDIPPGASVDLIFEWKPEISVKDFLDQWGKFRFVAIYNGITYEKSYDENFVRGLIQNTIPGVIGPRMTPKGQ